MKRTIEVFTADCPCCREALELVRSIVCANCDVQVLDLRQGGSVEARAKAYGVHRVPAIVINGQLADCCRSSAVETSVLRALGVGDEA